MSTVTLKFSLVTASALLDVAPWDLEVLREACERFAYDDTGPEECASWLHCADLAHQLAGALKRLGDQTEERRHSP